MMVEFEAVATEVEKKNKCCEAPKNNLSRIIIIIIQYKLKHQQKLSRNVKKRKAE